MKKYLILSAKLFLVSFLFSSCSKSDDSGSPSGNSTGDPFISSISQAYLDSLGPKTYFFGNPDSEGRFTGNETDSSFNQNLLIGKTNQFDITFTVIKDQFSTYVDYAGKLTDTTSNHIRMVVYSKFDTLYLRPQ